MSKEDPIEGGQLTQEQADAIERASDREPLAIKTRELPSRPIRSDGPTWNTKEYTYNYYLLDTKNERIIIYLCITILAIVAIIYW